jgi:hypothetical protein
MAAITAADSAVVSPVTACSAVTQEQVQAAVGRTVRKGVETNAASESTCDFQGSSGLVSISIHRLSEPVSLDRQKSDLSAAFQGASFQPAAVGGANGFVMMLPDAGLQVHVTGETRRYLIVTVLGFGSGAAARTAAESIARAVLLRTAAHGAVR